VWYDADPAGQDMRFWSRLHAAIPTGTLLIVERGYTDVAQWAALRARSVTWLTRAKSNLKDAVDRVFVHTSTFRIVWSGSGTTPRVSGCV
jgi:hypothetical protein